MAVAADRSLVGRTRTVTAVTITRRTTDGRVRTAAAAASVAHMNRERILSDMTRLR